MKLTTEQLQRSHIDLIDCEAIMDTMADLLTDLEHFDNGELVIPARFRKRIDDALGRARRYQTGERKFPPQNAAA